MNDGKPAYPPYPFKGQQHWFYQRIEPQAFHFNEVLFALKIDRAARRALLDDPDRFIAEQGLSEAEGAGLKTLDIATLNAAGSHPILGWTVLLLLRFDKGDTHGHA
jgi:hypothetical protein